MSSRPMMTTDTAIYLVEKLYGIKGVIVTEMIGYEDKNYYIKVNENNNEENLWLHGYTLKVINALDSKNPSIIEAQTEMALYLGRKGVNCPQPVKNLSGQYYSLEEIGENGNISSKHLVRMLTFVPGKLLTNVPITNEILFKTGKLVTRIDEVLKGFNHPVFEQKKSYWCLEFIPQLRKFISAVEDPDKVTLVTSILDAFDKEVIPHIDSLEKGILHADLNENNILMSETLDGSWDISAIIDFGDSHYSCLVFELAIHITHLTLLSKDPLNAGGHIIAGYNTVRKLPDKEFSILKTIIIARLCQLLINGAYFYKQDPGNEYLLTWAKQGGWSVLNQLWNTHDLLQRWKNTVSSYQT